MSQHFTNKSLISSRWWYAIATCIFVICSTSLFTGFSCKKTTSIKYYTIAFNSNGGSSVDTIKVASGSKATKPTDPTRAGYTFAGWYTDQTFKNAFDFNTTVITSNITLYAKWTESTFTVTFNTNGADNIPSETIQAGGMATKPTDPAITNYTFQGWYADPNLTQMYNFQSPVTANITIYAKWSLDNGKVGNLFYILLMLKTIPTDLTKFDTLSQQVLSPYASNAALSSIYVTEAGAGSQDGSSWLNAYPASKLQSAIDNISDAAANKVYVVLIGAGTYMPTNSIAMKNNVAILGGWPTAGGWMQKASDTTSLNGRQITRLFKNSNIDHTALLYGVKIVQGSSADDNGGGMFNDHASPSLINIVFRDNVGGSGGAMYNCASSPILTNVAFTHNTALLNGGAITNSGNTDASAPVLTNVIFSNNTALVGDGGGIYNSGASPILINTVFTGNTTINTTGKGGGIYNTSSVPIVVNAIFWGNIASADSQYNAGGKVVYSVVQNGSGTGINNTDPGLAGLSYTAGYFMPTITYSGTSPNQAGLYVKRSLTATGGVYTFYYSIDGTTWYTDPTEIGTGTPATPPATAIDLTATDIQGRTRSAGRPDAGVWQH